MRRGRFNRFQRDTTTYRVTNPFKEEDKAMTNKARHGTGIGAWLLVICSLAGLVLATIAAFNDGNGIAHTPGSYLVFFTTALLVGGSLLMAFARTARRWLRGTIALLVLLDLLGTAFAAYLLEAYWLAGLMVAGLVAWLIHLFTATPPPHRRKEAIA